MSLKPKTYNLSPNKGFTLVELLIYMGIFVVVAGIMTGILVIGSRTQNKGTASTEVVQQLDLITQTVQRLVRDSSLIEATYEGATSTGACTTYCRLVLRMDDSAKDPTVLSSDANGVYLKEGNSATTTITSNKIIVDYLRLTKLNISAGHSAVNIDISLSYNSSNPQLAITKTLQSAVARVSAATFDSDLLPNTDNTWDIGQTPSLRWKNARFSGDLTVGGKVGVGTTSPGAKLHVEDLGSSALNGFKLKTTSGTDGVDIWWDTGTTRHWQIDQADINSTTTLRFSTNDIAGNDSQAKVVFLPSGDVGIGTTTPLSKLDVRGDSYIKVGSTATGLSGTPEGLHMDYQVSDPDIGPAIRWTDGTLTNTFGLFVSGGINFQGNASNPSFIVRTPTTDGTLGTSVFQVDGSAGSVGINVTPSSVYHLYSSKILTDPTAITVGSNFVNYTDTTVDVSRSIYGSIHYGIARPASGTTNSAVAIGSYGVGRADGAGNINTLEGARGYVASNNATAVVTTAVGVRAYVVQTSGTITNGYGVRIEDVAGTNQWGIYQVGATDNNYFAGNVGIGTSAPSYKLQLSTDSAAKPSTNTWTVASDARIKKDIRPFKDGLDVIMDINPVLYKYNGKGGFNADGKDYIGVIAQDIQNIAPYTINSYRAKLNPDDKDDTELLNFNSHAITFNLINAVKELKAENDALKVRIEALEAK